MMHTNKKLFNSKSDRVLDYSMSVNGMLANVHSFMGLVFTLTYLVWERQCQILEHTLLLVLVYYMV